jgi:hypothetical protein
MKQSICNFEEIQGYVMADISFSTAGTDALLHYRGYPGMKRRELDFCVLFFCDIRKTDTGGANCYDG